METLLSISSTSITSDYLITSARFRRGDIISCRNLGTVACAQRIRFRKRNASRILR